VTECGARAHLVESVSAIQEVAPSRRHGTAVVDLGGALPPDDVGLEAIRLFKQYGYKIIAHARGSRSWPIGKKCKVLLAGAASLLDYDDPKFTQELRRLLADLLRAETEEEQGAEELKRLMHELGIVGTSSVMIELFHQVRRFGPLSDLPVLITGETGTGKELLAVAVQRLDPKRREGPFVPLNCGALNRSLAESELFGYQRGAFTGADRNRKGLIRAAHGGVLFLDEIGELDGSLQPVLLRVLQESRVRSIGEDHEIQVNVRVIAATNRNLENAVQHDTFRADLFHRLNVLRLHVPRLRERAADIGPLIEHFLGKYGATLPFRCTAVAADFVEALTQVDLPGNVRQLGNIVWRALINKSDQGVLCLGDLPAEIWKELSDPRTEASADSAPSPKSPESLAKLPDPQIFTSLTGMLQNQHWSLAQCLQYCERVLLQAALHQTRGNQSRAAQVLGITPRSVYNKVHKHQLWV